ncbi:MAG: riboflavin biosynthesis protein RibD [Phycisphaerae bacterium]|nr:Riboflavin biosynthesis protein RibD [Phycisphaerales bacterium]
MTGLDDAFMSLAARAALRGQGLVEPNPMVGCVLVRGGAVIGIGHHRRFGGLHAEREAIAACRAAGRETRGATAYVTLEPCNGVGKQPPCTEALVEAGIARVVYAARDPNPSKAGGAEVLRSGGMIVDHLAGHHLAERLSAPFRKLASTGVPWVTAKWAQTIDGRIATRTGQSQWISSRASRRRVHRLRARVDAVLTGVGTVLADDPLLTARPEAGARRVRRVGRRVVIDSKLMTPVESKLVASARQAPVTIITTRRDAAWERRRAALLAAGAEVVDVAATSDGEVDLSAALRLLGAGLGVSTVLVEAGPRLLGGLLGHSLIDEAVVHLAPMIMADELARPVAAGRVVPMLTGASRWRLERAKAVGPDVELWYARADAAAS